MQLNAKVQPNGVQPKEVSGPIGDAVLDQLVELGLAVKRLTLTAPQLPDARAISVPGFRRDVCPPDQMSPFLRFTDVAVGVRTVDERSPSTGEGAGSAPGRCHRRRSTGWRRSRRRSAAH